MDIYIIVIQWIMKYYVRMTNILYRWWFVVLKTNIIYLIGNVQVINKL